MFSEIKGIKITVKIIFLLDNFNNIFIILFQKYEIKKFEKFKN